MTYYVLTLYNELKTFIKLIAVGALCFFTHDKLQQIKSSVCQNILIPGDV